MEADPNRPGNDPVTDIAGPGDGVLPAWSTRLIRNPANKARVVTIKADIEHLTMMNAGVVQRAIAKLLNPTRQALRRMFRTAGKTPVMKTVSSAQLYELIHKLEAITARAGQRPERQRAAIRRRLGKLKPEDLQKFLARAYIDALKSPSQISGTSRARSRGGKKKKRAKRRTGRKRH
jgi:hypothetical protein